MNYDQWATNNKIIIRKDYRLFHYMIDPTSPAHLNRISKVNDTVEGYFKDKTLDCVRTIERWHDNNRRCVIKFGTIDDANMFYIAMAEYVTGEGYNFN
tara:strand:+ start:729 stop:1022 length:294 start_codon:yes stop_codon:yes gene_type:complete